MGFKKGEYVRCINEGMSFILNAVYRVEEPPTNWPSHLIDPVNIEGVHEADGKRFIPWVPQKGDWLQLGMEERLVLGVDEKSTFPVSLSESGAATFAQCYGDLLTPILARAPKQIEEKTELAIGDEVEILPSRKQGWFKDSKICHGRRMTIDIFGEFEGEECASATNCDIGWWPIDSLRKINGGSGAVAPATPEAAPLTVKLRHGEYSISRAPVAEKPDIDALWTDGDVRQWADEHEELRLDKCDRAAMRHALWMWLRKNKATKEGTVRVDIKQPTPRIPTYRQITMNEKAFLEPRILG